MNRKPVAINGVFSQETGALGQTYVFLMTADPPVGLSTTQSLLVVYDGLPDPSWRPGARIVVYGQTSGYTVLLGARLPLLRADGISSRIESN
jgi:hypothetical protein